MRKIIQALWYTVRLLGVFFVLALISGILVLYPPFRGTQDFIHTISRISSTELDTEAVREIAKTLPDDPKKIEHAVRYEIIRYERSWKTYGYPWYYPTVAEAVAHGAGDCKSQAIVFMSILLAKGIDISEIQILYTTTHMWVQYPDKTDDDNEQPSAAVGSYTVNTPTPEEPSSPSSAAAGGEVKVEVPERLIPYNPPRSTKKSGKISLRSQWQLPSSIEFKPGEKWQMAGYHFWEPAPQGKKAQLIVVWYLSLIIALLLTIKPVRRLLLSRIGQNAYPENHRR